MILHAYFARRTLSSLLMVSGVFAMLILMIEFLEQVRIFGSADLSMSTLLYISLLRLPYTLYTIAPILTVIATLVLFLGLARSSELVVTRAAGRSALRSLRAPLLLIFVLGIICVAIGNPISATASRQYEHLKDTYLTSKSQAFSVSDEGLWLRQGNESGQVVIHAARANLDGSVLFGVSFSGFSLDGTPDFLIEAQSAALTPGKWQLTAAKKWSFSGVQNPEAASETFETTTLETSLTLDEIQDTFGDPAAVPIWHLPEFIQKLEKSGFSAQAYKMWFQMELALPLTLVAMMLIGAGFTMRHTRFGKTSTMVLTALILAFLFFFLRNFASILGTHGQIPILLAAWAPPVAVILTALSLLLHLEDG
jgi:lipopolysaccharide export system permease protein